MAGIKPVSAVTVRCDARALKALLREEGDTLSRWDLAIREAEDGVLIVSALTLRGARALLALLARRQAVLI
jgi:hypothetical protein